MGIDYATLERALMRLFNLSETQRVGLSGRLKYLGRLNALALEPTGRARRAYRLEDVLRVALILELEDVGIPPKQAARMVRMHWPDLQENIAQAWRDVRALEAGKPTEAVLWTIVPQVLSEMGAEDAMGDVTIVERAGDSSPQQLVAWNPPALGADRHAIFIHLPKLLAACCEAFGTVKPQLASDLGHALDVMSGVTPGHAVRSGRRARPDEAARRADVRQIHR